MSNLINKISDDLRTLEFFEDANELFFLKVVAIDHLSDDMKAYYKNKFLKVLSLVESGISYDWKYESLNTYPLFIAAAIESPLLPDVYELVELMLAKGANPNYILENQGIASLLTLISIENIKKLTPFIDLKLLDMKSITDLLTNKGEDYLFLKNVRKIGELCDLIPEWDAHQPLIHQNLFHHIAHTDSTSALQDLLKIEWDIDINADNYVSLTNYHFNSALINIVNDEAKYQQVLKAKCDTLGLFNFRLVDNVREMKIHCYNELNNRPDLSNPYTFNNVKISELVVHGNLANEPKHHSNNPVIKALLSNTYSKIVTKENLGKIYENLYSKHPILKQVLTAAAKVTSVPTFLVNDLNAEFNFNIKAGGYYSYSPNLVVAANCNSFNNYICKETLIHELSHMIIDKLFNNYAQPYPHNPSNTFFAKFYNFLGYKDVIKLKYEDAVLKSLKNIAHKVGVDEAIYNSYTHHSQLGPYLFNNYKNLNHYDDNFISSYHSGYYTTVNQYNAEFIVRLPESLTLNDNKDLNATLEAVQPLQEFWEQYIAPALEAL